MTRNGRIILLNGTSSAGKSTLARALRPKLEPQFCFYASDQLADADFRPIQSEARVRKRKFLRWISPLDPCICSRRTRSAGRTHRRGAKLGRRSRKTAVTLRHLLDRSPRTPLRTRTQGATTRRPPDRRNRIPPEDSFVLSLRCRGRFDAANQSKCEYHRGCMEAAPHTSAWLARQNDPII